MQRPIIPALLSFITGLLLGHWSLYFPYTVTAIALCGIAAAVIALKRRSLSAPNLLLVLPGLAGAALYIYSALWLPAGHYTHRAVTDKADHEVTGMISSALDRDPGRTSFELHVHTLDDALATGTLRVSVREEIKGIGYGDIIRASGKLFEPGEYLNPAGFDYAAYLAQSSIYYMMSVKNTDAITFLQRGSGIFRMAQDWREQIRQSFLSGTSGRGSAILQAMVLGEEGQLTDEMRDRFMAAGVTHIISISGSHLGMLAALCFGLIRWLLFLLPERWYHRLTLSADPKKIAAWLTLPFVVLYTLLAGGQVATVRSLIMITAGLAALILDRENALLHTLALAAFFILVTGPQALFSISFQLSFLSVLVIAYVVSLWNDIRPAAHGFFQKLGANILLLTLISLATSLATAPLVAHYFNQASAVGIISNMVVVPFAGMLVVPVGLFSGVASLFMHHLPFAGLNQLLSDWFMQLVFFFSRIPAAEFHPPSPPVFWLVLYGILLLSAGAYVRARLLARFKPFESYLRPPRAAVIGLVVSGTLLSCLLVLPLLHRPSTTVSFPDVGQGDCALIEFSSGQTMLIDGGGTRDNRFDIGRRIVAPFLWNRGIRRLDIVVLSHPHPDHMNGLVSLLKVFDVGEVWESGMDRDLPGYDEFQQMIRDRKITARIVSAADTPVSIGTATVQVLHPAPGFSSRAKQAYAAENDRSLVLKVQTEGTALLFTGDIGISAEADLLETMRGVKCDLMKVPHHGSKSSSSDTFLAAAQPGIVVVTVGRGNPYRHPAGEVLERYEGVGSRIYRTDTGGATAVSLRNGKMEIVQWAGLMLNRIELQKRGAWEAGERENWKRLLIRSAAF